MSRTAGAVTKVRQEPEGRRRLWAAIRFLGRSGVFGLAEIAAHARTGYDNAAKFARRLELAGYLKVVKEAQPEHGLTAKYRLLRNSGPKTPIVRFAQCEIYDPNDAKTYPTMTLKRTQTGRERALAWIQGRPGLWTVTDLVSGTAIQLKNAQKYLTELSATGVVTVVAQITGPEGGNGRNLYQWVEVAHDD